MDLTKKLRCGPFAISTDSQTIDIVLMPPGVTAHGLQTTCSPFIHPERMSSSCLFSNLERSTALSMAFGMGLDRCSVLLVPGWRCQSRKATRGFVPWSDPHASAGLCSHLTERSPWDDLPPNGDAWIRPAGADSIRQLGPIISSSKRWGNNRPNSGAASTTDAAPAIWEKPEFPTLLRQLDRRRKLVVQVLVVGNHQLAIAPDVVGLADDLGVHRQRSRRAPHHAIRLGGIDRAHVE